MFANDPGDQGSIPGRVIPKIQKMVLDTSLHYKVWIQGKELHPPLHFSVVVIEKGAFESPK